MKHSIEFSQDQFKTLVRLIFYGEWILNSTKIEAKDMDQKANNLINYVYKFKDKFNIEDWFQEYEDSDEIDIKESITLKLLSNLHEFEEDVFWENLVNKLVERDMIKKYSLRKLQEMNFEERIRKEEEFRSKYYSSFEKMGIIKLVLKQN